MKDAYFQFVNFIQEMPIFWFSVICLALISVVFLLVVKFYKIYNGTQKGFEKLSYLVLALILFGILVYLTYVRI